MLIRMRFPASLLAFGLLGALSTACGWAQTPTLKLRLGFDEASGTTTASDTAGGGVGATVQMLDYAGAPVDRHGSAGSGVAGDQSGMRALDLTSALGQGTNGPVAALTNASLGFGEVTTFTATLWFKARSQQSGNIGPRLFAAEYFNEGHQPGQRRAAHQRRRPTAQATRGGRCACQSGVAHWRASWGFAGRAGAQLGYGCRT
jgi:hypothetical protein